jgi:hypothetical protein
MTSLTPVHFFDKCTKVVFDVPMDSGHIFDVHDDRVMKSVNYRNREWLFYCEPACLLHSFVISLT